MRSVDAFWSKYCPVVRISHWLDATGWKGVRIYGVVVGRCFIGMQVFHKK